MKNSGIFSARLLCAAAAGTAVIAAVTVTAAASPPSGPTELNWSRRPVLFSHQTHLNAPALRSRTGVQELCPAQPGGAGNANGPPTADTGVCMLCHHPVDGMTRHLACATRDCHDNLNPRDKSVHSYYLATPARPKGRFYSCVACHTEQAGDDAPAMKRMAGCEESVCHAG
jgi:hypothetical protein